MLNSYINSVPSNHHDFALGVELPTIQIESDKTQKNYLIGLQYTHNKSFKRNLYDVNTKKLNGVIEYKTIQFNIKEINNIKKYKIYILDD